MDLISLQIALAQLSATLTTYRDALGSIQPPTVLARELTPEEQVRMTFSDAPFMVSVLRCESGFRQFDSDGTVLKSPTNDYGVAQINERNIPEAEALGYDVFTTEGNLAFARRLYEEQGTRPWVCARLVAVAR